MLKRIFDIFFSGAGLVVLSPFLAIVAIAVKLDSKGPVIFRQIRVGRNFKEFGIYKFRTMENDAPMTGPQITVSGDKRVTRAGKFLRKYKIDELPQLINVLKGDMSFVGPRPEVRKYVEMFKSDYAKLLQIRPGITDPASIKYSEEEKALALSTNWEEDYINIVLPSKIRLSSQYIENRKNIFSDVCLILKTIFNF
ncbi:MAG: sugar transferase [Nitrospirae bacterium]|nr:sugar transferase [Nitrospirota bacterium]